RLLGDMTGDSDSGIIASVVKGNATGEQVVEGTAQAVDVCPDVDRREVLGLLRGDVIRRARGAATLVRQTRSRRQQGEPKVEDLDLPLGRAHEVGRLDVTVDLAPFMGVL